MTFLFHQHRRDGARAGGAGLRLLHDEACGDWFFRVLQGARGGVIALAKRAAFVTCCPLREPGELWFALGDTCEAALARLKREVLS